MQGFLRIFTKNLAFYKQYIMYSLLLCLPAFSKSNIIFFRDQHSSHETFAHGLIYSLIQPL